VSKGALNLDPALAAHLVSARRLEEGRGRCATGVASIDALLGGGWPQGALSERIGRRSCGRSALLLASLARAIAAGETVALVDAGDRLDPRRAAACGVPLPHLLWIRGGGGGRDDGLAQALKAIDLVVAAGGFGLVVLDVGEAPPRVPTAVWIRLKHAAERQRTAVVVATPARAVGPFAAAAVALLAGGPRFRDDGPPLFEGLRAQAERLRGARGAWGGPAMEMQTGEEDERCASLAFSYHS
jgi:hypothetical protein